MKVFLVFRCYNYEGEEVEGIFTMSIEEYEVQGE